MADLFGPDDGFADEQPEPAVASRDVGDGGELRIDDDDAVVDGSDEPMLVQAPAGLPSPSQPTAIEIALHWLTHLPYRSWCRWCVSAKRRNAPHLRLPDHSREIPLLVADYCFVRDSRDDDLLTVFVGRLYPSRAIVAIPCDVRGVDDYAVGRLAQFLRDCGVKRLVHMSDQERSLGAMITSAMDALSGSSDWAGAVRENSAVGESQSNGKAEAAVQAVEDQIRVMKAALESRLSARIPSQHPVMKWMVEYAAVILNKYAVQPSGRTAYHDLHGKRVSERLVEFGETVLHYVPKKHRHKLDMRWGIGVFLGTTMSTNESFIGLSNGTVIRCRAINRVRPDKRWSHDLIQKITGTPAEPRSPDDAEIEAFEDPHANAGDKLRDALEEDVSAKIGDHRRTKINKRDIAEFEPSPQCPKCRAYVSKNWKQYDSASHTELCRMRFYRLMEERSNKEMVDLAPADPAELHPADVAVDFIENELENPVPAANADGEDPPFNLVDDSVLDAAMQDDAMDADAGDHPYAVQFGMDVDMLMSLGIEPAHAVRFANKCMRHTAAVTFMEAYGRGGLSDEARKSSFNIRGLRALDLACPKDNGDMWDFSKARDRAEAMRLIETEDPDWIVGSPPCTAFSLLNVGLNFPKMPVEDVKRRVKDGLVHLKFVCQLYRQQIRRGKWFLHEHPATAMSWKTKPIERMLRMSGVLTVDMDQCMFGLVSKSPDGLLLPAKKPTRWMTNSPFMVDALNVRCDKSHQHQHLVGGRAADAAFYPPKLLRAILRGMALTRDAHNGVRLLCENEKNFIDSFNSFVAAIPRESAIPKSTAPSDSADADPTDSGKPRTSSLPLVGGGTLPIEYASHNFKAVYRDEYTGEELPNHLVRAAMEEELNYFNQHVWDAVEKKLAYRTDDFKLVRMRWVICNKADDENYDVRARLVACEINTHKSDDYFASTPPLEAKRLLFSEFAATARRPDMLDHEIVLSFVDIRKAYFNGIPKRNVHLAFPKELGVPDHLVAHLKRCVYGTRDAGAIWEECYANALVEMGFTRGVASPCCFHSPDRRLRVVVHGDDFTCLGPKAEIIKYENELASRFEIKRRGHLGEFDGCVREIRILNRILRLTDDGLRYEADPRHAEMLVRALDLASASSVLTPGVKEDSSATEYDAPRIDEASAIQQYEIDAPNVAALAIAEPNQHRVRFDVDNVEISYVVPYSEIYGVHPKLLVATRDGWRRVPDGSNPYTGCSERVGTRRMAPLNNPDRRSTIDNERHNAINSVTWYGEAWNDMRDLMDLTDDNDAADCDDAMVGAVRTASSKKKNAGRHGAKAVKKIEMAGNIGDLLTPEQATTFRALSARGNYLAQDRVDISFSTKELCREFAAPANSSQLRLKRLARFLVGAPRLVYRYDWLSDADTKELTVYVDTDFAGCRVSRRSTNGGTMLRGTHCLKHWSSTQPTIALSSGEAELGGLCRGAANAIGLRSVARDLGMPFSIRVRSDATAALGIARRLGIGKIRHLDTSLLWIQQKIKDGDLTVDKVLGADNPADCLTKHVDRATMLKHLRAMGLEYEDGRAEAAPKLAA